MMMSIASDSLAATLDSSDLAGLLSAFNTLSSRLESTHIRLQDEVERLRSELSAANAELERSRRLSALGEMAAGIAHEVRNPLGSINLYARMLEQDLGDRPSERAIANRISAAVRGLDAIVNDVLTFSRESRIDPSAVAAEDLVEDALNRCADLLDRGVQVVRCPGLVGCATTVECDRGLMVQALANVIRNAAEATLEAGGGSVIALDVRTSADLAGSGGGVPMVVFRTEDSGPGISDEILERMFNPFFTTRTTGTGLGLPIVHRIAEAHGGRVVVQQHTGCGVGGQGATIEIHIPGVFPGRRVWEPTGCGAGRVAERHEVQVMERAR